MYINIVILIYIFIYLIVSNLAPLFLIVPLLFLSCSFLSFPNLFFEDWCHSPLPDWIADAGELVLGVDMGAPQDSRRDILVINSNSN